MFNHVLPPRNESLQAPYEQSIQRLLRLDSDGIVNKAVFTPPEGPAGSLTMQQSGKSSAAQAVEGLVLRGLRPPQPALAPTSRPRTKPHPQRRVSKGPPLSHPQAPSPFKRSQNHTSPSF